MIRGMRSIDRCGWMSVFCNITNVRTESMSPFSLTRPCMRMLADRGGEPITESELWTTGASGVTRSRTVAKNVQIRKIPI